MRVAVGGPAVGVGSGLLQAASKSKKQKIKHMNLDIVRYQIFDFMIESIALDVTNVICEFLL
jgi:hypothetical protein